MKENKALHTIGAWTKKNWRYWIFYVVIVLFIVSTLIIGIPNGPKNMVYRNMFQKIGIALILAISLSFVVGYLGELSLGHAGFMCLGAYIGGKVSQVLVANLGWSLNVWVVLLSCLVGGTVAAFAGFIIGLPALRLKGDYLAIVTLAFGEIVRIIFQQTSEKSFGGPLGLVSPLYPNKYFYIIVFGFVMFTIMIFQNIIRSKHGRAITAIRDNEIAARATGVDVTKYKLFAFSLSSFFAGIAGTLFSFTVSRVQNTSFDYNYSIEILVMVVLGGIGSIHGSILAAAFITFLNVTLSTKLTGNMAVIKNVIYALILILVLIYNNAPSLKFFREKYNFKNLIHKIHPKSKSPEVIHDDPGKWDRIPTKISMDEILSVDLKAQDLNPDKKEDKK